MNVKGVQLSGLMMIDESDGEFLVEEEPEMFDPIFRRPRNKKQNRMAGEEQGEDSPPDPNARPSNSRAAAEWDAEQATKRQEQKDTEAWWKQQKKDAREIKNGDKFDPLAPRPEGDPLVPISDDADYLGVFQCANCNSNVVDAEDAWCDDCLKDIYGDDDGVPET